MNTLEAKLAVLRERFHAMAEGEAAELEQALRLGDLEAVRRRAHGLAGRSGMFGFDELGALALAADEAQLADLPGRAIDLIAALRRLDQGD